MNSMNAYTHTKPWTRIHKRALWQRQGKLHTTLLEARLEYIIEKQNIMDGCVRCRGIWCGKFDLDGWDCRVQHWHQLYVNDPGPPASCRMTHYTNSQVILSHYHNHKWNIHYTSQHENELNWRIMQIRQTFILLSGPVFHILLSTLFIVLSFNWIWELP